LPGEVKQIGNTDNRKPVGMVRATNCNSRSADDREPIGTARANKQLEFGRKEDHPGQRADIPLA
jgi:hypothetical protein